MTDLAPYRPNELTLAPTTYTSTNGNAPATYGAGTMRLIEWAKEAEAAHQLATALCETPFAGQFAKNPGAATAAILKGAEVGLTPVTSLGAFDLIQGTPAPKAITLRALVQSHGHEVIIDTATDLECKARGRRRGSAEWQHVTWTIKQAERLKLTGKDNWQKQPKAMLVARATSEVCRLIASDVILGIGYSTEELEDTAAPPAVKRVQRAKPEPPPMPEPDLADIQKAAAYDADPDTVAADLPDPPPITPAQVKKMATVMGTLGITDRDQALKYVADTIGRTVESRNDLTKTEASLVIDALEREQPAEPEPAFDE